MEPLRRISPAEAENYVELSIYDEKICTKAIAFTLTPDSDASPKPLYGETWEKVTYYGDPYNSPLHPLEIFLNQYNDIVDRKDRGDVRDSNDDYVSIY